MQQDDAGARCADRSFRHNEITVLEGECLGADKPRIAWDRDEYDDQNESGGSRSQHGDHRQGKKNHGERAHGVKEQNQNAVKPAGAETGDQAQEQSTKSGETGCSQRN